MHDFILALIGGAMIGLAAVILMAVNGRILGVSGIVSDMLPAISKGETWQLSFILGVFAAPAALLVFSDYRPPVEISGNTLLLVTGGLLVGVGTVMGNGCTSGHGVCGLPRLSIRSIVATGIFMATAILTVFVVNAVTGA